MKLSFSATSAVPLVIVNSIPVSLAYVPAVIVAAVLVAPMLLAVVSSAVISSTALAAEITDESESSTPVGALSSFITVSDFPLYSTVEPALILALISATSLPALSFHLVLA